MTPTTLLYDLARNLLATGESSLVAEGLTLPSHRFVSWNRPADDCCDHLVVHVSQLFPSKRSRASSRSQVPGIVSHEASLVLTYITCAAVGDPIPTDAAMDSNAQSMLTYSWVLYQGVACSFTADSLDSTFGEGCRVVSIEQGTPSTPQGGCERIEILVKVQLS